MKNVKGLSLRNRTENIENVTTTFTLNSSVLFKLFLPCVFIIISLIRIMTIYSILCIAWKHLLALCRAGKESILCQPPQGKPRYLLSGCLAKLPEPGQHLQRPLRPMLSLTLSPFVWPRCMSKEKYEFLIFQFKTYIVHL